MKYSLVFMFLVGCGQQTQPPPSVPDMVFIPVTNPCPPGVCVDDMAKPEAPADMGETGDLAEVLADDMAEAETDDMSEPADLAGSDCGRHRHHEHRPH